VNYTATYSGAGHPAAGQVESRQTAGDALALSPDLVEALSDILAEALVLDYLADLNPTVGSPRGVDHG
jgi:hypothetical protein